MRLSGWSITRYVAPLPVTYISGMPTTKKPPKETLTWRVVQAPREKAAEAVAVTEFNLSDGQRKRLV